MNDTPEKKRVDSYLDTVARMEPDVTPVDREGALASIAISLKRIADAMEPRHVIATQEALSPEDVAAIREWWRARFELGSKPPPPLEDIGGITRPQPPLGARFKAWMRRSR